METRSEPLGRHLLARPHSLGTSIEWKPKSSVVAAKGRAYCPHSLGTSIEWKQPWSTHNHGVSLDSPHSLGTSIEWKHFIKKVFPLLFLVPTRWGHQLNGNIHVGSRSSELFL